MLGVYFWPTGTGRKIMLEQCGLSYNVILMNNNTRGVARGAYRQVGGLGHIARLNQYPNVKRRSEAVGARPAVRKGADGDRTPGP